VSTYLPPGTPVRVLRPDLPAHATGVVAEGHNGPREVWVWHADCGCWGANRHVRGYLRDEIEEAT